MNTRRGGRVAEGAPLLREYTLTRIVGSNPTLSAGRRFYIVEDAVYAPVAQLDRATVYGTVGWRFESSLVR
jgi:hypothetical protein